MIVNDQQSSQNLPVARATGRVPATSPVERLFQKTKNKVESFSNRALRDADHAGEVLCHLEPAPFHLGL
jgi:hypothetical protein